MWKWWVIIFLFLSLVVYWGLGHVVRVDKTWFVSCPAKHHWQVDKGKWQELFAPLRDTTVVYLSCDLVETNEGAGEDKIDPLVYAARDTWLGQKRVIIYLNTPVLGLYDNGKRGEITSFLIAKQMATVMNMGKLEAGKLAGSVYYAATPLVQIDDKGAK